MIRMVGFLLEAKEGETRCREDHAEAARKNSVFLFPLSPETLLVAPAMKRRQ